MLICLDFGGSSIKYGVLADLASLSFAEKGSVPNTFADQKEFLAAVFDLVRDLRTRHAAEGIAISYCGELDHEEGLIHSPGMYFYNGGLALRKVLEEETGLPVSVENDGNAGMLAEWKYGCLQGLENAAMIVLGSGVAGSFILDGHLHTGKIGFSGILTLCLTDITRPLDFDNIAFSSIASGYLMREYLRGRGLPLPENPLGGVFTLDGKPFAGREFFELYEQGDPLAQKVLQDYAGNVARFLLNLQCILEVQTFAISGGITAQDRLIEAIREEMEKLYAYPFLQAIQMPKPQVVRAEFGNDANLVGAAIWYTELYKKEQPLCGTAL